MEKDEINLSLSLDNNLKKKLNSKEVYLIKK